MGSINLGDLSSYIGGNNIGGINLGELILEDQGSNDNRRDLILGN